jgi:hypothetical protein
LGLALALIGGAIKIPLVLRDPQLFEYIFFSGIAYVALICGLVLVVLGIGQRLLFGPEQD